MSIALVGLGWFAATAQAGEAHGLQRALVATAVTAGAEGVATVQGAALGIFASPLIGDRSSGIGAEVASGAIRGGAAGLTIGTLGGGFLAAWATDTSPELVGGVPAAVGLVGLVTALQLDRLNDERANRIALGGTLVAVPVVAGIAAALAKPRPDDEALSVQVSPTFGRDGGGVRLAGRF